MSSFDIATAEGALRERLDSLARDSTRCLMPIVNGPGPAFFPAVLYGLATVDYLSSCWAGWNDSGGDRSKSQTKRIAGFLEQYCHYGAKESLLAVSLWRHKLMHTGEPRVLRNVANSETYWWEIDINGTAHMQLIPIDAIGSFGFQINPTTLVRDLETGIFGTDGYLSHLKCSPDLQTKFDSFMRECQNYTVKL